MKLYIKGKVKERKVYYPYVNGLIVEDCPFKTATEAQQAGEILIRSIVEGEHGEHRQLDILST